MAAGHLRARGRPAAEAREDAPAPAAAPQLGPTHLLDLDALGEARRGVVEEERRLELAAVQGPAPAFGLVDLRGGGSGHPASVF